MVKKKHERESRPDWLLCGTLAALAIYLLLFLASPFHWSGEHRIARGPTILPLVLLPDEVFGAWFHSPTDLLLLDRWLPLVTGLGIVVVAGMAGYQALVWLRVLPKLSILEQVFFAEAAGLNLVSTYTLAVGLLGGLHDRLWFVLPGAIVVAAFCWQMYRHGFRDRHVPAATNAGSQNDPVWLNHHWLWLAGAFAVFMILGGLLPPNEFDVREYHLQVPKEFFLAGNVHFLPHNLYGNMALGAEMHSLLGMVLLDDWWTGALVGKAVIAFFSPLTALGLLATGRRFFSPGAGILAAILYVSIPSIANVSNLGFIEGASACYLFATLYSMLLVRAERDVSPTQWILPGYLAGAAVACKYPGLLFVVAPLGAWLLWMSFVERDEEGRRRVDWLAPVVFGVAVLLGCGLWLGKNWALAGNPLYPLLYDVFGGRTWTAEKSQMWNYVHRPAGFTLTALAADVYRVLLTSDWLSPLLIPLAALAFVRRRAKLVLGLGAYFSYIILAWWMLALRIDRYWIPAMPVLALLAGAGALWCRNRVWQYTLLGLLIFNSIYSFLAATLPACTYPPLCVPYATLKTEPHRLNPWHAYLNEHASGTVLMVGEAQVFDLEVPVLYNTWLDDSIFEAIVRDPVTGGLRPADEICAELTERNVSHVFVSWIEIARYRQTEYGNWDFVQPKVFETLVKEGVLEPIEPPERLEGTSNAAYRVVCSR